MATRPCSARRSKSTRLTPLQWYSWGDSDGPSVTPSRPSRLPSNCLKTIHLRALVVAGGGSNMVARG